MKKQIFIALLIMKATSALGQISVGIDSPHPSSILDLDVSNLPANEKKGFLLTRMTQAERDQIVNPSIGLMIYNTSNNCLEFWNSENWISRCGNSNKIPSDKLSENTITNLKH